MHHGGDRFSCFGAADRVECPEGVEPAGFGLGAIQPLDELRNDRRGPLGSGFAGIPFGPTAPGDRAT